MSASRPRMRNLTLALTTLAAIAIAFVGYYYFYVQRQEQQLDQRNTRVLNQIRNNIIQKNKTYVQNAVNNSPQNIEQLHQRVIEVINDKILQDARREAESFQKAKEEQARQILIKRTEVFNNSGEQRIDIDQQLKQLEDSLKTAFERQVDEKLRERLNEAQKELFPANSEVLTDPVNQVFLIQDIRRGSSRKVELSFEEWQLQSNQRSQLRYQLSPDEDHSPPQISLEQIPDTMAAFPPWRVNYNVWVTERKLSDPQDYRIQMYVGLKEFLRPMEREDIFDGMLLIRQKTDSSQGDPVEVEDLIYSSIDDPGIVNYLVKESHRLREYSPDDSVRVEWIESLPYRLYSTEMVFQRNRLLLVGLASVDRFEQEKLGISTVAIITISLIAFLILLAFPLLKLVLMSNYERLSLGDLLLAVISALLGTFLLSQLIIDGYGFNGPDKKRRGQQLVELSKQVNDSLEQELKLILQQLQQLDHSYGCKEGASCAPFQSTTKIWADSSIRKQLNIYPYFQSMYWTDQDYRLVAEWTRGSDLAPQIRLSDRRYLNQLETNAWRLPGEDQLPSFRLESLLARTSGEQLAVVSIESGRTAIRPADNSTLKDSIPTHAVFLTTRLRSLHDPVLPPGFGFAVIAENGLVWFHSEPGRNLQENFLAETNDPSLDAAIQNRASLKISGSYLGKDHEFYLQPLKGMPLNLVVFRETNVYRSTHAQILTLTFFLIAAAFFSGLLFIIIQILVNPRSPLLKNDQFTFDWLRPDRSKRRSYRQLILMNLVLLILAMFISPTLSDGLPVLSLIGLLYIYTFILAFLKLNKNVHEEFQWEEHKRIVITTAALLLAGNGLLTIMSLPDFLLLLLFQIVPVLFLIREIGRIILPSARPSSPDNIVTSYLPVRGELSWWRKTFYGIIAIIDVPLRKLAEFLDNALRKVIPTDTFRFLHAQRSYRVFLLIWLMILSVFPVVRFYEFAYNKESERLIKFGQIHLLDQLEQYHRSDWAEWQKYSGLGQSEQESRHSFNQRPLSAHGIYSTPFFNTSILHWPGTPILDVDSNARRVDILQQQLSARGFAAIPADRNARDNAYVVFDSALSLIRPNYTPQARLTQRLPNQESNPDQLLWKSFDLVPDDRSSLLPKSFQISKKILEASKGEEFTLVSDLPFYRIPGVNGLNDGTRMLYYLLVLAFLFTVYYLIKFVIRKFFAHDFIEQVDPDPIAATDAISNLKRHIYLTIPPRSMVRDYLGLLENKDELLPYIREDLNGETRDRYVFDLRKEDDWSALLQAAGMQKKPVEKKPASEDQSDSSGEHQDSETSIDSRTVDLEIPVLIIDHFEEKATEKEGCNLLLKLIDRLLDLGPTIILVCPHTPVELQEAMTNILIEQNKDGKTAEKPLRISSSVEAYCSQILGEFTRVDYPLPVWYQLGYDTDSTASPSEESEDKGTAPDLTTNSLLSAVRRTPDLDASRPTAQFYFLSSAVLNHESDTLQEFIDTFLERKLGKFDKSVAADRMPDLPLLLGTFGFECVDSGSNSYRLDWRSKTGRDFLIDDHSNEEQVRELIDKIDDEHDSDQPVRIFSSLAPQELVQLLLRKEHSNKAYIHRWDRLIHRFELVEIYRDFRHIKAEERVAEIIREECMYDPFLQGLQTYMRRHLAWLELRLMEKLGQGQQPGDRRLREAVIIEIEQQAHLYYQALWNGCSEEERYLIYDLAQDGLVNTYNRSGINNLVRKGLIRRGTDSLELMNHSFRNFVLTVVDEEEALKMEKKIRQEGTWSRIRIPITLILLAVGIFIFYFQANLFDDTLGLITALAAAVPAINSIFERVAALKLPGLDRLTGWITKKNSS